MAEKQRFRYNQHDGKYLLQGLDYAHMYAILFNNSNQPVRCRGPYLADGENEALEN